MNKTSAKQESKEETPESKLFGLPRPLAGALIGFLLFLFVSALAWNANVVILQAILLLGGQVFYFVIRDLANMPTNMTNVAHRVLYYFIVFGVSSIPYAILGSLIFSKKSTSKSNGIFLLVIYFLLSICIGTLAYAFAQD